jgi:hypothetical protein
MWQQPQHSAACPVPASKANKKDQTHKQTNNQTTAATTQLTSPEAN